MIAACGYDGTHVGGAEANGWPHIHLEARTQHDARRWLEVKPHAHAAPVGSTLGTDQPIQKLYTASRLLSPAGQHISPRHAAADILSRVSAIFHLAFQRPR